MCALFSLVSQAVPRGNYISRVRDQVSTYMHSSLLLRLLSVGGEPRGSHPLKWTTFKHFVRFVSALRASSCSLSWLYVESDHRRATDQLSIGQLGLCQKITMKKTNKLVVVIKSQLVRRLFASKSTGAARSLFAHVRPCSPRCAKGSLRGRRACRAGLARTVSTHSLVCVAYCGVRGCAGSGGAGFV